MNVLYFQFMQTVAAFIVQAVKIDQNKDGKISGSEIGVFFSSVLLPLLLNSNSLKDQWTAFYSFIKELDLEGFKKALLQIVEGQLLPSELKGVEEKVDKVANVVFNLIDSVEKTISTFKDLFANKKLEVRLIKKGK